MKRRLGVWIVAFLPLLAGCFHAAMMGVMGIAGVAGHRMLARDRGCAAATAAMYAHLGRLDAAGGDSLPALVPVHREQVETLLSRCVDETGGMQQPGDTTWRPSAAELRQDLIHLSQLEAADLPAFMVEHRARIARFLAMREGVGHVM